MLELLAGPKSLNSLADTLRYRSSIGRQVERLRMRRVVLRVGLTPTGASGTVVYPASGDVTFTVEPSDDGPPLECW